MAIERPDPATATYAQAFGYDAARNVENVTKRLRQLADYLDQRAVALVTGDGKASDAAADIVQEYFTGLANAQVYMHPVIYNAGKADTHHERQQHQSKEG